MKHKIDLSKYDVRTDLISELIEKKELNGVINTVLDYGDIVVNKTLVEMEVVEENLVPGRYITISFDDITDNDSKEELIEVFRECLTTLLQEININDDYSCLLVGLGNEMVTADSLGPLVVKDALITKHLFDLEGIDILDGYRNVSSLIPGVMGNTGIESSVIIESIVKKTKPDFLIVIDALCASSVKRLNKTIQISTSGIKPGSGVKNERKEITSKVLGVPVIAIGVPTVTTSLTICRYILESLTFDDNIDITTLDRLDDLNVQDLIVSVKEVDTLIKQLSEIISKGINSSIHRQITL